MVNKILRCRMVMRAESSAELASRKGSKFFSQCGTLRYGAQYREKYRESIGSKIRHKGTCAKGFRGNIHSKQSVLKVTGRIIRHKNYVTKVT